MLNGMNSKEHLWALTYIAVAAARARREVTDGGKAQIYAEQMANHAVEAFERFEKRNARPRTIDDKD